MGNSIAPSDSGLIQVSEHNDSQLLLGSDLGIYGVRTSNPEDWGPRVDVLYFSLCFSTCPQDFFITRIYSPRHLPAGIMGMYIRNSKLSFMTNIFGQPHAAPKIGENFLYGQLSAQEINEVSKNRHQESLCHPKIDRSLQAH